MRAGCEGDFVDMQCRAFEHIRASASNVPGSGAIPVPEVIRTSSGDLYTTVWDFLENDRARAGLIGPRLRAACGLPVTDTASDVMAWLDEMRGSFAPVLGCDLSAAPMGSLSVEGSTTPQDPFSIAPAEAADLGAEFGANDSVWLGYYRTAGFGDDWPGAADPDELFLPKEIFPNPAALLNLPDERTALAMSAASVCSSAWSWSRTARV